MQKKHIIVGLSGGVDSSVTACLLKKQGHHVTGVYMKNWDDDQAQCTSLSDEQDAKHVCEQLDIDFSTVNFSKDYMDKVFAHMLSDLKKGHTPNPDILCNQEIKFKVLLDYALKNNAEFLATGHYANIESTQGNNKLMMAKDQNKDQTYFLSRMPKEALNKVLFPIGNHQKSEIRELAKQFKLENALKKDSTGICFIGERKFSDFISDYLLNKPGIITDEKGHPIGKHNGLFYYTIGQRKGLGIGGMQNTPENPWFVVEKDMENNTLICVQGDKHPALYHHGLSAQDIHWLINPDDLGDRFEAKVRIRHRQSLQNAKITIQNSLLIAHFETQQRAIAPGQSIVMYIGQCCIGSAIIEKPLN